MAEQVVLLDATEVVVAEPDYEDGVEEASLKGVLTVREARRAAPWLPSG